MDTRTQISACSPVVLATGLHVGGHVGGLDGNGQIDVIGAWRSVFPPTLYLLVLFEPLSVEKHNNKVFPPKSSSFLRWQPKCDVTLQLARNEINAFNWRKKRNFINKFPQLRIDEGVTAVWNVS